MSGVERLYSEVVRAALVLFQVNTVRLDGFREARENVPVIPGAFPGEGVEFVYSLDPRTKVRSVRVSVPSFARGALSANKEVGPLPVPREGMPEVPAALSALLDEFARTGPRRLQERFRGLVRELLRAGVDVGAVHAQVDLALAESVMEE